MKARSVFRVLEAKPLENWGYRRIMLRVWKVVGIG
jgi:hypothetical protein